MKYLFSLCVVLFTLSGCKKSEDVTPVNQVDSFAGEYTLTSNVTSTIDGKTTSEKGSGTLSVFKGNKAGTYYFLEKYPAYEKGYMVNFVNNAFTIEQNVDVIHVDNIEYYCYQNGTGTVDGNKITMSKITSGGSGIIRSLQGLDNNVFKPITKTFSIVATK